MSSKVVFLQVILHTPHHSAMSKPLTYKSEQSLTPGTLVNVPLGKKEMLGVVWEVLEQAPIELKLESIQFIHYALVGIAPLSQEWMSLVSFTARYYQRSLGEVAIHALPAGFKNLDEAQLAKRLAKLAKQSQKEATRSEAEAEAEPVLANAQPFSIDSFQLATEQKQALEQIQTQPGPFLLFGVTGSGKTEVYLQAAQQVLSQDPKAQVLIMVPEINLTPQLHAQFSQRFTRQCGPLGVVAIHSGLTEVQRFNHWLLAHTGAARIILGTRLSIFSSIPHLQLIVVDEEHDPSYKSQDASRYSARDLAIYRANQISLMAKKQNVFSPCKIILGSATPSLESWYQSRPISQGGRYQRLHMTQRIGQGVLPRLVLIDMTQQAKGTVLCPELIEAIKARIQKGEQTLIFLNRRGYAPVLVCNDCGWKSQCPHCSAFRVFHKRDRTLRCHHCGFTDHVPRSCPSCGNLDISSQGRGTEQLEEQITELLVNVLRLDGKAARVIRLDADSTKNKGSLESSLAEIHAGNVDVIVGTQMIAKGHDFRNITLVAAVNPDSALFSSDFRAPERLFSLLLQASGRAGREASKSEGSEMWIQTFNPDHALFKALGAHDYVRFAAKQLQEREQAQMSPFSFSALLRADAKSQEIAQSFLQKVSQLAEQDSVLKELMQEVLLYSPVPMTISKVANIERAQLMVECHSRPYLQKFLTRWQHLLRLQAKQTKGLIRWVMDVDPHAI